MENPSVAIVILNWNGRNYLSKFLPHVLQSTYANFRVVVADNGSSDDSVSFVKTNFPNVEIISFSENHGFAKGYNLALAQVSADFYILLNSDVQVSQGWIEPLVALAETDQAIAACQPKILSFSKPGYFEYAGGCGGWLDSLGYPFARGRVFDYCEEDTLQYEDISPVFWASGAALFIRSEVFHAAGGFDPYFFAHQEEIDLCWRLQLAGNKIYVCPQSVVYHVGGGTLPRGNSLKTYLNFRNNHIMLSKNLPWPRVLWVLCVRNLLDAVSAWKGLLSGDGGYFVAILRAHAAFVKWWLFYRHRSVFPKNKKASVHGYLRRNMAWQHFIKKRKFFSEIVGKRS
jgi:GT2 family glycosyltransferase